MAIKINNNVIIDDSRNIVNAGIVTATKFYGDGSNLSNIISGVDIATAGGTVGTGATILDLRGAGISTVTVSSGIATINIGGGGGSGTFDTGITTSVYVSVSAGVGVNPITFGDIFSSPSIAYTFPSTSGYGYILESIHITNKSGANLYLSGRHDFNGGAAVPISNHVPVPYQGSFELLEQPRVANPSDIIRLQALSGIGTTATGVDGGLDAFITISAKEDVNYIGVGKTVVSTDQEILTASTYPAVIQSINLTNYNDNVDTDVTVSIFRGGTVGGIATTGVRLGYLAFNLTVPKNSVVELCQKPKQLLKGDSILVTSNPVNSVGVIVAGKYIV